MNRNANNLYGWDIIENHGCGLSLQISLFLLPIPRQKIFLKNKFCSVSYITAQKPLDAVDASFSKFTPNSAAFLYADVNACNIKTILILS